MLTLRPAFTVLDAGDLLAAGDEVYVTEEEDMTVRGVARLIGVPGAHLVEMNTRYGNINQNSKLSKGTSLVFTPGYTTVTSSESSSGESKKKLSLKKKPRKAPTRRAVDREAEEMERAIQLSLSLAADIEHQKSQVTSDSLSTSLGTPTSSAVSPPLQAKIPLSSAKLLDDSLLNNACEDVKPTLSLVTESRKSKTPRSAKKDKKATVIGSSSEADSDGNSECLLIKADTDKTGPFRPARPVLKRSLNTDLTKRERTRQPLVQNDASSDSDFEAGSDVPFHYTIPYTV